MIQYGESNQSTIKNCYQARTVGAFSLSLYFGFCGGYRVFAFPVLVQG